MRRHAAVAGAFLLSILALALGTGTAGVTPAATAAGEQRPNVLVVMTDDQTQQSVGAMPNTVELIGERGVTFENSFVSFPLCCPSRATFLTGQYTHNHGVLNNYQPEGGFQLFRTDETLAVWLQRAGYATGMIGKLMNGYNTSPVGVPPGWSEWHAEKTENRYYGYELFEGGQRVTYGDPNEDPTDPEQPETYSTDVYTDKAVDFIERRAPAVNPFFLWLSYNAPHAGGPEPPDEPGNCRGSAQPAARHTGAFAGVPPPTTPSFNEADVADKPRSIRDLPAFGESDVAAVQRNVRCQLASLLAVDEGVKSVIDALAATGELDETYVVFTSDNGFLHGEHRIVFGKHRIYEEALRVPLMIRGPDLASGKGVKELASNVDLSPTILDVAGADAGLPQDGRSLLPIAERRKRRLGREILVDTNRYRGIRNARYAYARYIRAPDVGEVELYDLERDPYELKSLDRSKRYRDVKKALEKRMRMLMRCEGGECRERPRLEVQAGADCTADRPVVALTGADAEAVKRVTFRVGRRGVTDRHEPFEAELQKRRLGRNGGRVSAEVTMIDGRFATLKGRVRC